jgi:hypothetical protein
MDRWFTLIVPLKLLCHMVYRQGQYYITGQLIITVLSVPSQLRGHRGRDLIYSQIIKQLENIIGYYFLPIKLLIKDTFPNQKVFFLNFCSEFMKTLPML